jgi:hypothetical protein
MSFLESIEQEWLNENADDHETKRDQTDEEYTDQEKLNKR